MRPFQKAGARTWYVRLHLADRPPVDLATGTREAATARAMARTLERVQDRAKLEPLVVALADRVLELAEVWKADMEDRLELLVAELADTDVSPLVESFLESLSKKVAPDTAAHYGHAIRTLIPEGIPFPASRVNADTLQSWVDGMEDLAAGTIRKRGAGMSRFCHWLVKPTGLLEVNPMSRVELPPPGKPRDKHLTTPEAIMLADRQPGQYRLLSALLAATALDVSTALVLTRRAVNVTDREIDAPGTKTHNRDRLVRVAEWGWPYVEELIRGKLPSAPLFDAIPDRWVARDRHAEAVDALVAEGLTAFRGYWMRDARHTWAVRAMRAGMPPELIARQLGHKDATLVLKVYGKYQPRADERAHWEKVATARDAALYAMEVGK